MKRNTLYLFTLILCLITAHSAYGAKKLTIGRIEKVSIPKYGIAYEARVDTGAHSCSMHVENAKVTSENGKKYIEFDTKDSEGKLVHIKTLIHKISRIRSTSGTAESRYVIREEVQMGSVKKTININLNDRSELKYEFLVGRNFLRGDFLVDVSLSHALED